MNTSPESQQLVSIARVLQAKPGQDLTARAIEVMHQIDVLKSAATPVTANSDNNWATLTLIQIAKTLGLPADKTMKDLPEFAVELMAKKK